MIPGRMLRAPSNSAASTVVLSRVLLMPQTCHYALDRDSGSASHPLIRRRDTAPVHRSLTES